MISIDEAEELLNEVAEELPEEFYNELNGGILLLPNVKRSVYAQDDDLWVLGEYVNSASMGRLINIYYGSFQRVFGEMSAAKLKEELREVLYHEFTHHMESLSGERGLEKKDEQMISEYLRGKNE